MLVLGSVLLVSFTVVLSLLAFQHVQMNLHWFYFPHLRPLPRFGEPEAADNQERTATQKNKIQPQVQTSARASLYTANVHLQTRRDNISQTRTEQRTTIATNKLRAPQTNNPTSRDPTRKLA